MDLQQHIEEIRAGIKAGEYPNEASVSQGIVLRLLEALSWPAFNTHVVCPQYSLDGGRVDFALLRSPGKVAVFIEVKQLGQSQGGERQLFEYAFHKGVPLAVLTDGQEWNFFLPLEQGEYDDRRFYRLDLFEREISDCAQRLTRYLEYTRIQSDEALADARKDQRDRSRDIQILGFLPKAWEQLLTEGDEILLELVADRVESLGGYKPDVDTVARFVREQVSQAPAKAATVSRRGPPPSSSIGRKRRGQFGFELDGRYVSAKNAKEVYVEVFKALGRREAAFFDRFAALPKHGRKRRYLARRREDLFPDQPDLAQKCSVQISPVWWLGGNVSRATIDERLRLACEVAHLAFGKDLRVDLGD